MSGHGQKVPPEEGRSIRHQTTRAPLGCAEANVPPPRRRSRPRKGLLTSRCDPRCGRRRWESHTHTVIDRKVDEAPRWVAQKVRDPHEQTSATTPPAITTLGVGAFGDGVRPLPATDPFPGQTPHHQQSSSDANQPQDASAPSTLGHWATSGHRHRRQEVVSTCCRPTHKVGKDG